MLALGVSSTITVRNISDEAKRMLRERAARKGKSMEAEVRDMIENACLDDEESSRKSRDDYQMAIDKVTGIWKDRFGGKTTDKIMAEMRGTPEEHGDR